MKHSFSTLLGSASAAALALGAFGPSASAQNTPKTLEAERVAGAVKYAGVYHAVSGTWTRSSGTSANFGPDTVYSNTAPSGYSSSAGGAAGFAPGSTNFDEGVLPTWANTNANGNANRDEHLINCVTIGYCDLGAPGSSGWEVSFYSSYEPCTLEDFPDATLQFTGLPAGGCWTLDFDLSGGAEVCIAGDGGDGFDDDPDLDSFGWSYRYIGADGSMPAGFLLSGDPRNTDPNWSFGAEPSDGTNTYFGVPSLCGPDAATGFFTEDTFWLEDPTGVDSGCYYFGGYTNFNSCGGPIHYPYSSWHLELQADVGGCTGPSGLGIPSGCVSNPNSTGVNSTMIAWGSVSIAQNYVILRALVPRDSVGFFLSSQSPGFVALPGGSAGNICLGSNVARFQASAMSSGPSGLIELSTLTGQLDLASIPYATGSSPALAGTPNYFQCWHRDSSPSGPTSNFTDGWVINWAP